MKNEKITFFPILLGMLYLLLMACHLPLPWGGGHLFWEDVLLPVMAAMLLCHLRDMQEWKSVPGCCLLAFLAFSLFSAIFHGCVDARSSAFLQAFSGNLYEFSVFFYGAVLYFYYAEFSLPRNALLLLAFLLFCALLGSWLFDCLPFHAGNSFHFSSDQMKTTAFSLLARRFAFTFQNPNLAGSFMALPYLLLALAYVKTQEGAARPGMLFLALLAVLSLIPLTLTMSKHLLLSLSMTILLFHALFLPKCKKAVYYLWIPVLLAGLLFEVTVRYATFPLQRERPFLDTTPGMYTIHQNAYADMLREEKPLFHGIGPRRIREMYPAHVDRERTEGILARYNAQQDADVFCAFLDPHCEYLNLASLFGFLALGTMLLFLLALSFRAKPIAFYFVLALLFCMLWDDILSKRWIWVCLGLLAVHPLPASASSIANATRRND